MELDAFTMVTSVASIGAFKWKPTYDPPEVSLRKCYLCKQTVCIKGCLTAAVAPTEHLI